MSGVKHTPGPWAVEDPMDHCLTIVANPTAPVYDWKWVATCDWPDEESHDLTSGEVKANARLIAAAPCMFDYILSSAQNGCATAQEIVERATGDRPEKGGAL